MLSSQQSLCQSSARRHWMMRAPLVSNAKMRSHLPLMANIPSMGITESSISSKREAHEAGRGIIPVNKSWSLSIASCYLQEAILYCVDYQMKPTAHLLLLFSAVTTHSFQPGSCRFANSRTNTDQPLEAAPTGTLHLAI